MTYEITKQIASGNKEVLYSVFANLVKEGIKSGQTMTEAKREAKVILSCMAEAWKKTQEKFNSQ